MERGVALPGHMIRPDKKWGVKEGCVVATPASLELGPPLGPGQMRRSMLIRCSDVRGPRRPEPSFGVRELRRK